jgi:hypothetical protein
MQYTTHGHARRGFMSREYSCWSSMIQRCCNSNNPRYKDYGGRGIQVCKRWLEFKNFYEDVGEVPKGMTFDRRDNDGDYEPSNWRFATLREQANNNRRNVTKTFDGATLTVSEWARRVGMQCETLRTRLRRGMSLEIALTRPVRKK